MKLENFSEIDDTLPEVISIPGIGCITTSEFNDIFTFNMDAMVKKLRMHLQLKEIDDTL